MSVEEIRAYFKRLRPYFLTSLVLFSVGFILGVVASARFPELTAGFAKSLGGFVKLFHGLSKLQLAVTIFVNNAIKTLAAILFGPLFGLLPAFFLLVNGAALGLVMMGSVRTRGIGRSLMSILPHGIFELPAVFLGAAIGLMIGGAVTAKLLRRSEINLKAEMNSALRFFGAIILPVLVLAAIVEAYVTSTLAVR
jgi:stage II sporulation protein M